MKYILGILIAIFSTSTFAIFCPTNFSSVNFGDTIDTINQLCGPPNSKNTYTKTTILSQEWDYYVRTSSFDQSTEKLKVIFSGDRVININVPGDRVCQTVQNNLGKSDTICRNSTNRNNVSSTSLCGSAISIGDTTQTVQMACGKPVMTNQQQDMSNPGVSVTEYQYNTTPPVTLVFENGILKARK